MRQVPNCLEETKGVPRSFISKAPKGNGIGATGSKNWVWF